MIPYPHPHPDPADRAITKAQIRKRAWYLRHRERILAELKARYVIDGALLRARQKAWRHANAELLNARRRAAYRARAALARAS